MYISVDLVGTNGALTLYLVYYDSLSTLNILWENRLIPYVQFYLLSLIPSLKNNTKRKGQIKRHFKEEHNHGTNGVCISTL